MILRSPLTSGLLVDAEHARDRVAVDVGVEGAGRVALGGERSGEVGGHRRLADAALARGDADHVLDRGERALGQAAGAAERLLEVGLLGVREDVEADPDLGDARRARRRWRRRPAGSGCGSGSRRWSARRRPRPCPFSKMSTERTMPRSTIERRSSGSMTARSASVICSFVGRAIAVILGQGAPQKSDRPATLAGRSGGEVAVCPPRVGQLHRTRRQPLRRPGLSGATRGPEPARRRSSAPSSAGSQPSCGSP